MKKLVSLALVSGLQAIPPVSCMHAISNSVFRDFDEFTAYSRKDSNAKCS